MPPPRILVLGLGNDVLSDDAVGLHVIQVVRERLAGEPEIEVKATTEMGLALLDEIVEREGLILVDSVQTGRAAPGQIHEVGEETLARVSAGIPHFLGVGETLALGKQLGLPMPQRIRLFTIEVADAFTLGLELSPAVAAAVPRAAAQVVARAREFVRSRTERPGA